MVPPSDIVSLAAWSECIGDLVEARKLYRQAVEQHPGEGRLWACLGRICSRLQRADEAAACFERALELQPDDPDLLCELGTLRMQQGELPEAIAHFERAISLRPGCVTTLNNLGLALLSQGRTAEARLRFQQAHSLRPDLAAVHNNLGLAILNEGQPGQAMAYFEAAIQLEPTLADAHNNRGLVLDGRGQLDEACTCFEHAVQLDPLHLGALTNLGNALKDQGRIADAITCCRKVVELRPDDPPVHSNLLLTMQYDEGTEPREMLAESRRYADQHARTLTPPTELAVTPVPRAHRLRIGYISPDFREHPVTHFIEPILAAHDHRRVEVFCYSDVPQPDAVTRRIQGYADCWRSLVGLSDAAAAAAIRDDRIMILIELAGHTAGNRLPALARKPAPVQMSYLGFLGTTGVPAIDFYITDEHADPIGVSDTHYQERLLRLPQCAFCYCPGPAPDIGKGRPGWPSAPVTFGCLNTPAKLSQRTLALWSRVLAAVPGSRLVVASGGSRQAEDRVAFHFGHHGINADRLLFTGRAASRNDYLLNYRSIDIALDPCPYNGVTTTCDALWMGVPVVSLAGTTSVSRQGVRFLRNLGLDELVAGSPDDYVQIATDLASDPTLMVSLHEGLRSRMRQSPLMDPRRLTRALEAACQAIWDERHAGRESVTPS